MDGLVSAYNSRELDIGTASSPGISELAALVNPRPIASHPQRKALCAWICLKYTHSSSFRLLFICQACLEKYRKDNVWKFRSLLCNNLLAQWPKTNGLLSLKSQFILRRGIIA